MIGTESGRSERVRKRGGSRFVRAASVTAVGRPRATSEAKLGPDRIAGAAPGRGIPR